MRSDVTVTDQFCGAGGSSYGAEQAGAKLKLALNHWPLAIETHNSNFPHADHDCTDVSACDPRRYPSTTLLITSPECTNHTLAQGRKRKYQAQLELFGKVTVDPAEERSRATMWDVVRFAEYHKYEAIIVENVVEVRYWQLWEAWLKAMEALGYLYQEVYFNSQFAHLIPGRGEFVPQSRDRVYIVFWKRGNKAPNLDFRPLAYCEKCGKDVEAVQVWKNPRKKWGKYRFQYLYHCPHNYEHGAIAPYAYGAWHAINWSLPIEKIGNRKKPLNERTLRRIDIGLKKFLEKPFVVQDGHYPYGIEELNVPLIFNYQKEGQFTSVHSHPLNTICGANHKYLVSVPLIFNYQIAGRFTTSDQPLNTICGANHKWLMSVPLLYGYQKPNNLNDLTSPLPTITTKDKQAVVILPPSFTFSYANGDGPPRATTEPLHTLSTGYGEGLVISNPTPPDINECGFRMFAPDEIQAGMAFPQNYIVHGTKKEKVQQLGNAVTPPMMELLVGRVIEVFQ